MAEKEDAKIVRDVERRMLHGTCAYCGKTAEGKHAIHRDGFGEGPEVPLCTACGSHPQPTEMQIWAKIGQAEVCQACDVEIESGDERRGSYHAWCVND
jgi:hypothetical protein